MSNKIDGGNKKEGEGFPGGPMVKNLPANAEDTGLITDPGRFPMPWSKSTHVPQLQSLCSRAQELQLLKPVHPRARALQQEKLPG